MTWYSIKISKKIGLQWDGGKINAQPLISNKIKMDWSKN